jgi:hypothetical protein
LRLPEMVQRECRENEGGGGSRESRDGGCCIQRRPMTKWRNPACCTRRCVASMLRCPNLSLSSVGLTATTAFGTTSTSPSFAQSSIKKLSMHEQKRRCHGVTRMDSSKAYVDRLWWMNEMEVTS